MRYVRVRRRKREGPFLESAQKPKQLIAGDRLKRRNFFFQLPSGTALPRATSLGRAGVTSRFGRPRARRALVLSNRQSWPGGAAAPPPGLAASRRIPEAGAGRPHIPGGARAPAPAVPRQPVSRRRTSMPLADKRSTACARALITRPSRSVWFALLPYDAHPNHHDRLAPAAAHSVPAALLVGVVQPAGRVSRC